MKTGTVSLRMTGADIPGTITRANNNGILVFDIEYIDLLTANLKISRSQFEKFKIVAEKSGNEIRILKISGIAVLLGRLFSRPVFLAAIVAIFAMSLWLPKRILFVAVEGNTLTPTEMILQQAEKSGVFFGAKRSEIRSEIVKNQLLETIPSLQWAGVNTYGCTAVIQVREGSANEVEMKTVNHSSIVAATDGIITSCTVLSGSAACAVGDAVKKDQVLISGYQDLGLVVKLTRSKGEVYAQTDRTLNAVIPASYSKSGAAFDDEVRYSLIIGKKRINLSKGSGIYYTGCDKIYTEYCMTLPGGFVLPVALQCERIVRRQKLQSGMESDSAELRLLEYAQAYLLGHIVSGKILDESYALNSSDAVCRMTVQYDCIEMIGRERAEEFQFEYGKDD